MQSLGKNKTITNYFHAMQIVLLIVWIVLSVLVGNYAQEHGESKGLIIFISLFTSPLIGFIIAAMNKKR